MKKVEGIQIKGNEVDTIKMWDAFMRILSNEEF